MKSAVFSLRLPAIFALLFTVVQFGLGTQGESREVPERVDVEDRYKWDLTDLFSGQDAWEIAFTTCEKKIGELGSMKGKAGTSAEALLGFLALREDIRIDLERVFAYAVLLKDQDMRAPAGQRLFDRAQSLAIRYEESTSWFDPEILALPEVTVREWISQHPDLHIYRHAFDDLLRQRDHVLSTREEELLAMTSRLAVTPRQVFSMLANADLKFPTIEDEEGNRIELSEGRYQSLMSSPDREVRQRAFRGLLQSYLDHKNSISAMLAGSVHADIFRARARHYDSALHAALSPDNVPISVYENLISAVHEHLPKLHRYLEIRRRELGVEKIHIYDTFIPLVKGEIPRITYDEAAGVIAEALRPLGKDYLEAMKRGFDNGWIDVYETQGKRSGAYSLGIYATHPYMLLNYGGTYRDMFTVAHEMGHSMHTWFAQQSQPPVYGDYPIFLAEVASTCNEILLGDYLRRQAKGVDEKLFLVNQEVENIRGTVITQTMFAEYEMLLHAEAEKGTPLTFETMSGVYRDLVKKYYGAAWGHDDEVDGYWLRIPHFYRAFYVYKYATSYCAAATLGKRLLAGEPGALDAYLAFLRAGGSDYPIQILKKAGVDMTTPAPIHSTMELFGELLDELDRLLRQ
jgi:oligoendopeptidase F